MDTVTHVNKTKETQKLKTNLHFCLIILIQPNTNKYPCTALLYSDTNIIDSLTPYLKSWPLNNPLKKRELDKMFIFSSILRSKIAIGPKKEV